MSIDVRTHTEVVEVERTTHQPVCDGCDEDITVDRWLYFDLIEATSKPGPRQAQRVDLHDDACGGKFFAKTAGDPQLFI